MKYKFSLILIYGWLVVCNACKKDWLDVKPDNKLVVLSSLSDYQSLMDNSLLEVSSSLGEVGSDNYFVYNFSYLSAQYINSYLWAPNGYGVTSQNDWTQEYRNILTCNTALTGLSKIQKSESDQDLFNQVYGNTLLHRGTAYYELAQTFIKPYDSLTSKTDLGLPLRLDPDITSKVGRGTVQQTYDLIFADLLNAASLLTTAPQSYKTRPTKAAAFAMLARAYLSVKNYSKALSYADSALQLNHSLLDYNTVVPSASLGMPHFDKNPEVFYYTIMSSTAINPHLSTIDTVLYQSYAGNDLRKKLFFRNGFLNPAYKSTFMGTYGGYNVNTLFTFPAVDELYLIKSECEARLGNVSMAMTDLNTLLVTRWKTGTFIPFTAANADDALPVILTERRKELVMRGVRWTDLRRLNTDARFASTITHVYNGQVYLLPPNDPKYVWPIPDDEILYSGIPQNVR